MQKLSFVIINLLFLLHISAQGDLSIQFGTEMVLGNNTNLVLQDMNLENDGTLDGLNNGVTVVFSGNSDATLNGFDVIELYNLKINKANSASLRLLTDLLVENNVDLTNGRLDLNGINLSLDGGQIINEDHNNYIYGNTGHIEYITSLNNPTAVNPGNLGIEISSTANLGQTVIRRGHEIQTNGSGGASIRRWFDVNPANNSGLDATLRMYYMDHELNSIPEAELGFYRSENNGVSWDWIGFDVLNAATNYIEKSGIDAFSRWTIGSLTTNPLPVELGYFTAREETDYNLLEWITLSERNVDYFEIQKLKNHTWIAIDRVEAAHFSDETLQYFYQDTDYGLEEYYRLRILDFDGRAEYSEVATVIREKLFGSGLVLYPNPFFDHLSVRLPRGLEIDEAHIYNASGMLMKRVERPGRSFDFSSLTSGIYFIELTSGTHRYRQKVQKQ